MSSKVIRGLSDENGSWNTICTCRRSGRNLPCGIDPRSTSVAPSGRKRISPPVGRKALSTQRAVGGLTATTLTNKGQSFAFVYMESHVVYRTHLAGDLSQDAALNRKELPQPLDFQKRPIARDAGNSRLWRFSHPIELPFVSAGSMNINMKIRDKSTNYRQEAK